MIDQIPTPADFVHLTRRRWIQGCAAGLLLGMIGFGSAHADDKLPKAAVSYRNHPNGSKRCSTCVHYIPANKPAEAGRCQIVVGPIGPQGYCVVWAQRNPTESC